LKAGEYRFQTGITPDQLLDQIVHGRVIEHDIVLLEGWTFEEMISAIDHNPYLKHTLDGLNTETIMARLGYPGQNPEGLFFPDTYKFVRDTPDVVILQTAYRSMAKHLANAWSHAAPNLSYESPYQALIVAS
ncbi:MAG: endolytic transglycosylase MltG, partial [Pseudomonadota bacterium]